MMCEGKHRVSGRQWFVTVAAVLVVCGMASTVSAAVIEGALYSWGSDGYGKLGDGMTTDRWQPMVVPGLDGGVTAIATGFNHSLVFQDGQFYAWGFNGSGRLGIGGTEGGNYTTPQLVSGMGKGVTAVAAGAYHSLAIQDGKLYMWGRNNFGQVGIGNTTDRYTPQPVSVSASNGDVTAVAAGDFYSLAIQDGALYAWGYNGFGQLGIGNTTDRNIPQLVSGMGEGVTAVAAGQDHCLAIQDGKLYAWGLNHNGQLGTGNFTNRSTPQPVLGMEEGITAFAAGGDTSMAVMDGHVYIWGYMLGTDYTTPQEVSGLTNIVEVAVAGDQYHETYYAYYALDAEGVLWAWGRNDYGQLGVELRFGTSTWITTPQRVGGDEGLTFASISTYGSFVLAIGGKPVPEPVSLLVLGVGAAGVLSRRRR